MVICGRKGGREEGRQERREGGKRRKGKERTLFPTETVIFIYIYNDLINERLKGCRN